MIKTFRTDTDAAKTSLVRVGRRADVAPSQMRVFDVAGTKVTVANVSGHLYAFDDRCTHAGCSLGRGRLDGTIVTCGCHGSQFDVRSGVVLRGPASRSVRSRSIQTEGADFLAEV